MKLPPGWWRCEWASQDRCTVEARRGFRSDDIIETLSAELSPGAGNVPEMVSTLSRCVAVVDIVACIQQGELSQEIVALHEDVRGIKLAQDSQIQAIKDEVKENTKTEIAQLVGYVVQHDTWLCPTLTGFIMFRMQREDEVDHRGCRRDPGEKGNARIEKRPRYHRACWRAGGRG